MSAWTHSICEECWEVKGHGRGPVRLVEPLTETCCFCGREHHSGIYFRENPAEVDCRGEKGEVHDDD